MTTTAFVDIQAALVAALAAAPALAAGHISANRMRPIPEGQSTAIVVRLGDSDGDEQVIGALDWKSGFAIECHARTSAGVDPVTAADSLMQEVWQRLGSLTDDALGASITVAPRIKREQDDTGTPVACATLHLTAQHRTPLATLQPWS